jgi:hypothetical protein
MLVGPLPEKRTGMTDDRPRRTMSDRIEEGGWEKDVSPPRAENRPGGLPRPQTLKPPTSNTNQQEKKHD